MPSGFERGFGSTCWVRVVGLIVTRVYICCIILPRTCSDTIYRTVLVLYFIFIVSPYLFPKLAVCDPDLTIGLPPLLTAATGMDALTHCIETYLASAVNPPADAIALDGLSRCGAWLERAVADGSDRHARWNMMMASLQSTTLSWYCT